MIRWYLKYKIRAAIDRQEMLPPWIQRKTGSDADLARYAKDYARMMQQLSSGAETWMQEQADQKRPGWSEEVTVFVQSLGGSPENSVNLTEPPFNSRPRLANSKPLRWAICMSTTVLLTFGLLMLRDRSNRNLARQESTRNAEMAVTATRAVWEKGQSVADQSRVVWDRTFDKLSRNLAERIGETALAPIEDGSRWLGEAINQLHNGALREQNNLIEMAKRFRERFEALKSQ